MKKSFGILGTMGLSFMLFACGNSNEVTNNDSKPQEAPSKAEQKTVSNKEQDNLNKNENTNNSELTTIGQIYKDDDYTVELHKISEINEEINIAPLKIVVQDLKVIKMSNMTEEAKQSFSMYAGEAIEDSFSYLQVKYTAENTEEKNIDWYSLLNVVTDKGQQIDAQLNDIVINEADMESAFLGKVKKEFVDGFLLKDPDI